MAYGLLRSSWFTEKYIFILCFIKYKGTVSLKVLLYSEMQKAIEKSGVGRALRHQQKALQTAGVEYTLNPKENYNIIHVNTVFARSFFLAKKARRQGKKVVYHAHSTGEDFRNSFVGSNAVAPLFTWWIKQCYQTGDLILTPTPYSKSLLEQYGIKKPIVPISNGIDFHFFNRNEAEGRAFREQFGFSPEDKIIIAVGLFLQRKGILDFVELAKQLPQYHFIWFGECNLWTVPRTVRKAVHTKLPNLHFPGYVPRETLRGAYSGSNLFFFPTYEETEGIVLLEALAMQIPVLVRDIPIYEQWLEDGRHLYKGKTVEEMREKMIGILEGRLPDLTQAGYQVAKERDIAKIGQQLKAQYERVLSMP